MIETLILKFQNLFQVLPENGMRDKRSSPTYIYIYKFISMLLQAMSQNMYYAKNYEFLWFYSRV